MKAASRCTLLDLTKDTVHAEGAATGFIVASDGGLSEGYWHGGPGVCLGDGQTEAYLEYMGMTGLASAWAMARRQAEEVSSQN